MNVRRVLAVLALACALQGAAAPASAAKPAAEPPRITSAAAVDSRTVDLEWTSVKGAHHYVVSHVGGPTYTSSTAARISDLYPGDEHVFSVSAETRRNQPLGTSESIYVATPPEGPQTLRWWPAAGDGYVRLDSDSGIGCATQDLGRLADDGTYTSLGDGEDQGGPRSWTLHQGAGTTQTYAVRCQGSGGLWSPWSEPTVVTLD